MTTITEILKGTVEERIYYHHGRAMYHMNVVAKMCGELIEQHNTCVSVYPNNPNEVYNRLREVV